MLTKIAIALVVALAVFFALIYTDWHRVKVQEQAIEQYQEQVRRYEELNRQAREQYQEDLRRYREDYEDLWK